MGIPGLWSLVRPTGKLVDMSDMKGTRLAVDVSSWLYEFARIDATLQSSGGHIIGTFTRICKLLHYDIKPILIFDGPPPIEKKRILNLRKQQREDADLNRRKVAERILVHKIGLAKKQKLKYTGGGDLNNEKLLSSQSVRNDGNNNQADTDNTSLYADTLLSTNDKELTNDVVAKIDRDRRLHYLRNVPDEFKGFITNQRPVDAVDIPDSILNTNNPTSVKEKSLFDDNLDPYALDGKGEGKFYEFVAPDGETRRIFLSMEKIDLDTLKELPDDMQYQILSEYMIREEDAARNRCIAGKECPDTFSHIQVENYMRNLSLNKDLKSMKKKIGISNLKKHQLENRNNNHDRGDIGIDDYTQTKTDLVTEARLPNNGQTESSIKYDDIFGESDEDPELALKNVSTSDNSWMTAKTFTKTKKRSKGEAAREKLHRLEEAIAQEDLKKYAHLSTGAMRINDNDLGTADILQNKKKKKIGVSRVTLNSEEDIKLANQFDFFGHSNNNFTNDKFDELAEMQERADALLQTLNETPGNDFDTANDNLFLESFEDLDDADEHTTIQQVPKSETHAAKSEPHDAKSETQVSFKDFLKKEELSISQKTYYDEAEIKIKHEKEAGIDFFEIDDFSTLQNIAEHKLQYHDRSINYDRADKQHSISDVLSSFDKKERNVSDSHDVIDEKYVESPVKRRKLKKKSVRIEEIKSEVVPTQQVSYQTEKTTIIQKDSTEAHKPTADTRKNEESINSNAPPIGIAADAIIIEDINEERNNEIINNNNNNNAVPDNSAYTRFQNLLEQSIIDDEFEDGFFTTDTSIPTIEQEILHMEQQARTFAAAAEMVTTQMIEDVQYLCQLFGVPYLVSPSEAEAQCAFLVNTLDERSGDYLVDAVLTEDSDIFAYGARRVIRRFFNTRVPPELYEFSYIHKALGLNSDHIRMLSILIGCDYALGIRGIGLINAMEAIAAYRTPEKLKLLHQWINDRRLKNNEDSSRNVMNDNNSNHQTIQSSVATEIVENDYYHFDDSNGVGVNDLIRNFETTHNNYKNNWIILDDNFPETIKVWDRVHINSNREIIEWHDPKESQLEQFLKTNVKDDTYSNLLELWHYTKKNSMKKMSKTGTIKDYFQKDLQIQNSSIMFFNAQLQQDFLMSNKLYKTSQRLRSAIVQLTHGSSSFLNNSQKYNMNIIHDENNDDDEFDFEFDEEEFEEFEKKKNTTKKLQILPVLSVEELLLEDNFFHQTDVINNMRKGKALTLHQPYASLVISGIKRLEGRNWFSKNLRGWLWIHSSQYKPKKNEIEEVENYYKKLYYKDEFVTFPITYPEGCVLGKVFVSGCIANNFDDHDNNNYSSWNNAMKYVQKDVQELNLKMPKKEKNSSKWLYVCFNPKPLREPVKYKGRQRIWSIEEGIHKMLEENLIKTDHNK